MNRQGQKSKIITANNQKHNLKQKEEINGNPLYHLAGSARRFVNVRLSWHIC
jgi:hypothetical protein